MPVHLFLTPTGLGPAPLGSFAVPSDGKVQTVTAYAYCNQHGVWYSAATTVPASLPGSSSDSGREL